VAEGGGEGQTTATQSAMPDVFISYASPDNGVAKSIVDNLEQHGLKCWLAPRNVKPGTVYAEAIVRAIYEAKAVVLVLSANAMASAHVGREVERAASKRKQIVAFRVDTTPLSEELEYFLSNSQWIDVAALGMPAALAKLAEAVGQGSATSLQDDPWLRVELRPAGKNPVGMAKRVAAAAAVIIGVGVAVAVGWHFWSQNHNAAQPAATVAITEKSIAVLPFTDMSENHDQDYFADGMAEEVLDLLVKIPGIKVIGRTSSFQFKGKSEDLRTIGAKLGAAYIVEGSIRKVGPRVRVTAQLIDARSGAHSWSESYDRDYGDILILQNEIATGIARALQLTVDADAGLPAHQLNNTEAYTLYLRGRIALDQVHLAQLYGAVQDFEQALTLEPSFLRAAEGLALAHVAEGFDEDVVSREAWQHARDAAQRALRIDPTSATAHGVLGFVYAVNECDWNAAQTEFSKALALNPRDPNTLAYAAIVAQIQGRNDDAARLFNASISLDPLNPFTQAEFGQMLFAAGDFNGAELAYRKAIAINAQFDGNHYFIARIFLTRGQPEVALKEIQPEPAADAKDAGLAMVHHAMHQKADSDAALARLIRASGETWPYAIATVHAYRGQPDEAFDWLEKSRLARDSDLLMGIRGDPEFAPLRTDPRYKTLLRKLNLPE